MSNQIYKIIEKYYQLFNQGKVAEFVELLSDDVVHEINHGHDEIGKDAFIKFMNKMNQHYAEKAVDIIIFADELHSRAAAEFFIEGVYLHTDSNLPKAHGQHYRIRVGAFFSIRSGKITRVTNYYNLNKWIELVKKS